MQPDLSETNAAIRGPARSIDRTIGYKNGQSDHARTSGAESVSEGTPSRPLDRRPSTPAEQARDLHRQEVKGEVRKLDPQDEARRFKLADGLLRTEARDQPLLDRDAKPITLLADKSPHAEGIRRAHALAKEKLEQALKRAEAGEQVNFDKLYTPQELNQKADILREAGFTTPQADALMRSGIAGLEGR